LGKEVTIRRRVPLLKFRHEYTPSIDLADVPLGGIFNHANGKQFMLIDRDPWKAVVIRYTWLDRFIVWLGDWVRDRFGKRG
jgi:hypothetical protein